MKVRKIKDDITIDVFSSSLPISATVPVRYERGVKYLKSKGYKIINGSYIEKRITTVLEQFRKEHRSLISSYTMRMFRF